MLGTKKQLVTELVEVMQVGQTTQKTFEAVMGQMSTQFPQMLADASATRKDLTPEQRERINREAAQGFERFLARFKERFSGIYSSQEYFEQVYYPVFAKYYSEAELRDLIVFYKSPAGQKLLQVQPEFSTEIMKRSYDVVGPRLQQVTRELLDEELERVKNEKSGSK